MSGSGNGNKNRKDSLTSAPASESDSSNTQIAPEQEQQSAPMLRKKKSILISNGNRERKTPRKVFSFNGTIQQSTNNATTTTTGEKSTNQLRTATSLAVPMVSTYILFKVIHNMLLIFPLMCLVYTV